MDKLDNTQLEQMLASEGGPHLSLFLPRRSGPLKADEDTIRLSNQVRSAESMLIEHWMTKRQAIAFLEPVKKLGEDTAFLAGRGDALAIYRSEDQLRVFRLDYNVPESLSIASAFRFRPLLPELNLVAPFYVLRIGKKSVHLDRIEDGMLSEVQGIEFPEGFERTLANTTADRGAQVHSGAVATQGKQRAVFHGQGGLPDRQDSELSEYMHRVDDSLCRWIADEDALVILAGVERLASSFRHVSKCARIAQQTIALSTERLSPQDLAKRAMAIASVEGATQRAHDSARVREHRGPVATDPEKILAAAYDGRIDALFIDDAEVIRGSFFPDTGTLREMRSEPSGAPEDPCHDLVEVAIIQTLCHRGRVYESSTDQMPTEAQMAAALRY